MLVMGIVLHPPPLFEGGICFIRINQTHPGPQVSFLLLVSDLVEGIGRGHM